MDLGFTKGQRGFHGFGTCQGLAFRHRINLELKQTLSLGTLKITCLQIQHERNDNNSSVNKRQHAEEACVAAS